LLVLLRLAIGWHFFFEGLEKIQSVYLGPTETSRPWTSEPYLREASGPLGEAFRRQVPGSDEAALERLTVLPVTDGQDPARIPPHTRFPPALARDWQAYFDAWVTHYKLDNGKDQEEKKELQHQLELARKKLEQCQDNTVNWLLNGTKKVKKAFPSGVVEVEETTAQRIQEYRDELQKLQAMMNEALPALGKDVLKEKLRREKATVSSLRTDLLKDLDERTEEMKKELQGLLSAEQKKDGPVSVSAPKAPVYYVDQVTMWGLTVVGACLLLGFFTRTACVAGAGFLLMFYLSMPPLPWVPENLRAEGHYLFINKNLIELLALLALATTWSGRWAGLDGLLHSLFRRRGQTSE
jgi:uncharacterized membrane protein YphA (DoxX/SURF4 family)